MPTKRDKPEEIAANLRRVRLGSGTLPEAIRSIVIGEVPYDRSGSKTRREGMARELVD